MTSETITILTKGTEERVKRMNCKINNPAYVAPENDRWRHENSSSDDENEKMSQMIEKKTRWWFVRDGKRKRTPKTSPIVPIPKEPVPKIVVKGPSTDPQQRLVDDTVLDPSSIPQEGVDFAKVTFEQYLQHTAAATQKDQTSSAQGESVKEKELEGVARDDSSEDADDESTEIETELDPTTLGHGKAQLKKRPTKKQKGSDEEDSTYVPPEKTKKLRAKRKVVQSGVLPRRVRARKGCASLPKDQEGNKEKHVRTQWFMKLRKFKVLKLQKLQKFKHKVFLKLKCKSKQVLVMIMLKLLGLEELHLHHHHLHKINLFLKHLNLQDQRILFLICLEKFHMQLGFIEMIWVLMMILMCSTARR
ncbi:hypothetical protein Hdeb2414_s0005g00159531 [Helianthus debilis subsp. tardiflorus]